MFRDILAGIIRDKIGRVITGTAATGTEGIKLCKLQEPELVLLDMDLPDMDGFQVADKITKLYPRLRILAVSSRNDEYTLYRVLRSGLFGFVDKTNQGLASLELAIREALEWRPYYSASVHQVNLAQRGDSKAFSKLLTAREQELLCMFGVGMRNEEIGEKLNLSPQTVQGHRRNIMSKLDIPSTPELIRYAMKKGFSRVSGIK